MPISTTAAALAIAGAMGAQPGGGADALRAPGSLEFAPPSTARVGTHVWSEDFELGFELGTLPQNGWTAAFDPAAIITDGRFILEGERSLRHMADGSGLTEFAVRSPQLPNRYGRITMRVMRNSPRSMVQMITADPILGNFNTRVTFEKDGRITVGQVNDAKDGFDFIDTGFTWTVFEEVQIGIETDAHGALRVFIDDELAFEGVEANFALRGKAGRIGGWLMWTDNQANGWPDGRGDTTTLDDFRFVAIPAPGGWALALGAGLGLGVRRRRRGFV